MATLIGRATPSLAERLAAPPLVLLYHALGEVRPEHDPHNLVLPPARFRRDLEGLLARGYEFIRLTEFSQRLRRGDRLERLCSLTLDDGTVDNAEVLPSLLEALQIPATVFVCPGLLGGAYPWTAREAGVQIMTADALRELGRNPLIDVGSHTVSHRVLSRATGEQAYHEMASSKRMLEELIDGPVESFAYPECGYSSACPAAAERAGYTTAVSCGPWGSWNPYELRRENPSRADGPLLMALKTHGAFFHIRRSPPGRLLRSAIRSRRRGFGPDGP